MCFCDILKLVGSHDQHSVGTHSNSFKHSFPIDPLSIVVIVWNHAYIQDSEDARVFQTQFILFEQFGIAPQSSVGALSKHRTILNIQQTIHTFQYIVNAFQTIRSYPNIEYMPALTITNIDWCIQIFKTNKVNQTINSFKICWKNTSNTPLLNISWHIFIKTRNVSLKLIDQLSCGIFQQILAYRSKCYDC